MKKILIGFIISFVILFSFSGCMEHRYYHQNHQHSDGYYHRHNRERPSVELRIHN